jgi:phosphoenolpyruvate carboxykinase (GTP)
MRVLKWIIERVEGKASAQQTALGKIPDYSHLDWSGGNFSQDTFNAITAVNQSQWQQELALHDELLTKLEFHLPDALKQRYGALKATLAT